MAQTLMTQGDYRKKILWFAFPLLIGNLFQQMYNTADSFIVGNFLGATSLAAVSGVSSIVFFSSSFFLGFSTGAGVVIARSIGARQDVQTEQHIHTTVALGVVLSIALAVLGVFLSPWLLQLIGTPDNVIADASLYLEIFFAGIGGAILYNFFAGILQAMGDSKHPLYYLVISSLVNIVLDIILITVFHMGVDGAAYATVFSEWISAGFAMYRLTTCPAPTTLVFRKVRFHKESLRQILTFGIPTALQGCVIDLSNIIIQSYVNSFGALAMAGVGAAVKAEGFVFLPVTSFSLALSTFVSQNMGAKQYDRVKAGIKFGLLFAVSIVQIFGVIFFFLSPQIISLFNQDPSVVQFGVGRSTVTSFFYFLVGFSHISSAVMRGLGHPRVPMIVMLVAWCAVRVTVLMTIGQIYHWIGLIYWIYPITWFLSSIIFLFMYRKIAKEELA